MLLRLIFSLLFCSSSLFAVHVPPPSPLMKSECAKVKIPGHRALEQSEMAFHCSLDERVKNNMAEHYWWSLHRYQRWLRTIPTTPQAPLNFGKDIKESNEKANAYALSPGACHFFSSISPSVRDNSADRTHARNKIVLDSHDMLEQCHNLGKSLKESGAPLCDVIEFAGHASLSVGLDTVLGIDERKGKKHYYPSLRFLKEVGACLRSISTPNAVVLFSTCGADYELGRGGLPGRTHYWPGKEAAQKLLSQILKMPVLSGIGFVRGTADGGAACRDGWHWSSP